MAKWSRNRRKGKANSAKRLSARRWNKNVGDPNKSGSSAQAGK